MRLITSSDLANRSDVELQVLCGEFIKAMERAVPFSKEWSFAQFTVDNVLRERARRLKRCSPRF